MPALMSIVISINSRKWNFVSKCAELDKIDRLTDRLTLIFMYLYKMYVFIERV